MCLRLELSGSGALLLLPPNLFSGSSTVALGLKARELGIAPVLVSLAELISLLLVMAAWLLKTPKSAVFIVKRPDVSSLLC